MTIEYDLEPKLATIKKLARERFKYDLEHAIGFELTDNDKVIVGDGHGQSPRTGRLPEWQKAFETMNSHVESICTKLRRYYVYDALGLTLITGRLTSRAGAEAGTPIGVDAGTSSIVGRLNFASVNYLQKVDAMLHANLWQGDAANAFQRNFVDPLGKANVLQSSYAWALGLVVQMFHDGLESLGANLNSVVDSCITMLPPETDAKAEAATNLSYTGIYTGALSLVPFPPIAIPAGVASLSAGIAATYLSETNKGPEPRTPSWPIEGDSAIRILESTWDAIIEVDKQVAQFDSKVSQVVSGYLSNPGAFGNPELNVQNPSVTSWPTSKIAPGQPGPIDQDPLVISVRDVYNAGYNLLPGFAQEYGAAVGICQAAVLDSNIGELYPRAVVEYAAARSRLERILADTSATAAEVGVALVEVTSEYDLTDAENSELIRQTGELPGPVPRSDNDQDPRPVRGAY